MTAGKRDANHSVVLMGVSSADGVTPVPITVDSITGRVRVKVEGYSGNSATPDRTKMRRDDSRKPTLGGETNDSARVISPLSIETANNGVMMQG